MNNEQEKHLFANLRAFAGRYDRKYTSGQKEHGGNMWEMGAYQALKNAEDEVLDMWSYLRQIRYCLEEIEERVDDWISVGDSECAREVKKILTRVKDDKVPVLGELIDIDTPIPVEVCDDKS